MVSVTNKHSITPDGAGLESWLAELGKRFNGEEFATIRRAAELAASLYTDRTSLTGAPLLDHALGTAAILATQNMDAESIVAAVLQASLEAAPEMAEKIAAAFGAGVVSLVDGVARMGLMREIGETAASGKDKKDNTAQIEALRKMMLAMVEDIRVVLIKLAERTQSMRELPNADEDIRRRIARETQDIFAPLANRLGVWQMKWELEDLSFRYLEPELYKKIAKLLDEKRLDREQLH